MQLEFRAYADDYTVGGATDFQGNRLADYIEAIDELQVEGVKLQALEDGRRHELLSATIARDELCMVVATGPRGRADLRLRTRAFPMRAEVGPYAVCGYFHVPPTSDPFAVARHRRVIALRPVKVAFEVGGERVEEEHETLLLIGSKIDVFERTSDETLGLERALQIIRERDREAEGLTGLAPA